jgi:hypothetical protein
MDTGQWIGFALVTITFGTFGDLVDFDDQTIPPCQGFQAP